MADSNPGATICPDCGEGITLVKVNGKAEPRHITAPGEAVVCPE
ncbi:hypothetical protein [Streptomyces globisporus]